MSQISMLYRLQQIDSQLDNARILLQNLEKELNDTSLVDEAKQNISEAEQKHKIEVKNLKDSENKTYDVRVKIELSESSLYGGKIHNPKELQDLQNEVASLKRLITTLEDYELEAMMAVEQSEEVLDQSRKNLHEVQGKQSEHNAVLNGERLKLVSQVDRLQSERDATIPAISKSDLELYDQLRKSRNGVAVAKISSRACGACGATLNAALIQSTQAPGQLIRCPTCGRILYSG
jgi:uncharacterized protein